MYGWTTRVCLASNYSRGPRDCASPYTGENRTGFSATLAEPVNAQTGAGVRAALAVKNGAAAAPSFAVFRVASFRRRSTIWRHLVIKGSDSLMVALGNDGVERVFGIPGEENLDFVELITK
jgi:hypothetical protein